MVKETPYSVNQPRQPLPQSECEERYLALVENTHEIIYCHDLEGNYTFMNRAGEELTGYSCEEAIKLNVTQVIAPEYGHLVQAMIRRKLRSHERSFYEIEILTKDGRRLPVEVSTHLIYSGDTPVGIQGIARDISQRRRREAVLVESEQRYRQLVNEATDIIYRIDLSGHFTFVNPIASKAMQRPREELVGLYFLELIREDYRMRASEFYRRQVSEKDATTYFEFPAITGGGTEMWIGQNVQLVLREGEPSELQAVARDITERKQIEEQLIESERRYRSLFNASPHPVWVYDQESFYFLAVNEAAIRTYGYSRAELLCMKVSDIWTPQDVSFLSENIGDETFTPRTLPGTRRHLRKDGTAIDVEITLHPMTLEGRQAVILIATDVTERVRAEAERQVMLDVIQSVNLTEDLDELLKFIQASLKKVLYAENCFVALYDRETALFAMPFVIDSSGPVCGPQEMKKSCTAYVFRTGEPILITPDVFKQLLAQGEIELVGNDSPSWLGVPLKTPAETIGVLAVQHYEDENAYSDRDLQFLSTIGGQIAFAIERKRAEEKLRLSEERFSKAFNFTPLSMSLTSLSDLRVIDVNNSFLTLNGYEGYEGYERNQVIGRTAQELNLWGDAEAQNDFLNTIRGNRSIKDRETQITLKDGSMRTYLTSAEVINLRGEECVLAVTNDITEHRALEEQLRQSQRMEAIGQLAGGVAHDFNNLLTAITGYSELSLRRLGISHPVSKNIEQIQKAGTRAAGLTRQLLAFSRRQLLQAKLFDLNALVADTGNMLQRLIGEDIDLITILKPCIGQIKADPGQIEQVLLNLVVNARDAMPSGGNITIETGTARLDEEYAGKHISIIPGQYVLMAVTDTGTGMDAATKQRIFEPFFTTKEVGKGTGLGLSTVYGIVKQSDGYIWVYSELGRGTSFKVYLPQVGEPTESEPLTASSGEAPRGHETVLLVEDEEQLRTLAKDILEESGYAVLEAANGFEGLRICKEFSARIDLMITDVVMPLMSGRELAEQVVVLRPETKVLYMSGYTNDSVVRHGVLEEHVLFLQKPFTPTTLALKVREVLDEAPDLSS
jgi:two-component system cell cycle sensor histidine kinase/response regulator CckA